MKDFIASIRSRLNKGIALNAILISLIIAATIALIWGFSYIFRGHAVSSHIVYPSVATIALISSLSLWYTKRRNTLESSIFADQFFQLKDTLTSALEFENKNTQNQIYQLQNQQATEAITNLSPESIPLPYSKKLAPIAIIGVIAAVSIAFIPPSEKVLLEMEQRKATSERTQEIRTSIEKEVESIIQSLTNEEKEAIDPDAIRQWVKDLKQTDNKREALRNIARVEQKIQKSIDSLKNRKNEELLKNAGLNMLKAQDAATKEMGKHLENKNFKEAAKKLKDFKFNKELDRKKIEKLKADAKDPEKRKALDEKQKKLAKLRELTKRLSQAARQSRGQGQGNSSNNGASSMSMDQFAELLEQHGIEQLPEDFDLEDLNNLPEELLEQLPMELLDQFPLDMLQQLPPELLEQLLELLENNAQDLQEMMEEMELEMMQGEPMSEEEWEELLEQLQNMDGDLEALRNMLLRMQAMRSMRNRLLGLQKSLGRAQEYTNGLKNRSQFQMRGGDKQPGTGSDSSRRKLKEELKNNKQYTKLKGQKGIGPSRSSIGDADSGTGTSSRQGSVQKRNFEHQMSSFIERDDVPEEMKQSVKQYFEDIHNHRSDSKSETK